MTTGPDNPNYVRLFTDRDLGDAADAMAYAGAVFSAPTVAGMAFTFYGYGPPALPVTVTREALVIETTAPAPGGDILAALDDAIEQRCACGCGEPLDPNGSAWYATPACQQRWLVTHAGNAADVADIYRRPDAAEVDDRRRPDATTADDNVCEARWSEHLTVGEQTPSNPIVDGDPDDEALVDGFSGFHDRYRAAGLAYTISRAIADGRLLATVADGHRFVEKPIRATPVTAEAVRDVLIACAAELGVTDPPPPPPLPEGACCAAHAAQGALFDVEISSRIETVVARLIGEAITRGDSPDQAFEAISAAIEAGAFGFDSDVMVIPVRIGVAPPSFDTPPTDPQATPGTGPAPRRPRAPRWIRPGGSTR